MNHALDRFDYSFWILLRSWTHILTSGVQNSKNIIENHEKKPQKYTWRGTTRAKPQGSASYASESCFLFFCSYKFCRWLSLFTRTHFRVGLGREQGKFFCLRFIQLYYRTKLNSGGMITAKDLRYILMKIMLFKNTYYNKYIFFIINNTCCFYYLLQSINNWYCLYCAPRTTCTNVAPSEWSPSKGCLKKVAFSNKPPIVTQSI